MIKRTLFATFLLGVTVTSAMANSDPVDLTLLSIEQLLEIKITGASKYSQAQGDVAAAVSVITREEIRASGWRNLTEAINSLPGVYSTYDRQYTYIGVRGFGLPGDYNTRVLVTINGNRINDSVYDQVLMGNAFPVDIDLIERIEFIPGPGGAVYGQNAMLGVINVVTRKGADLQGGELAASYQDPQNARQGRISWGQRLENGTDLLLSASGLNARGQNLYYQFPGSTTGITQGLASGLDGEHNRKIYTRAEQGAWMADVIYTDRSKDDPVATYFSDPLTQGQVERDRNLFAQMVYNENLTEELNLTARLFYGNTSYAGQYYFSAAPYLYGARSAWVGGEVRLLSTHWDRHKLMIGLEYQDNRRQQQTGVNVSNPGDPASNHDIRESSYRIGLFVQDEVALLDDLSVTLGGRIDHNVTVGTEVNPRAGLIWHADRTTTLKALYGTAFRTPSAYEQYYHDSSTVTNPAVQDEQIRTIELVGEHRLAPDLKVTAALYQWEMKDLLAFRTDPVSGLFQMQNSDKVLARGIDLSADKNWDWGARTRGSLSYQHSAYIKADHPLENSPNPLAKFNIILPWRATGLLVGGELQYNGDRRDLQAGTVTGHWLSNINLSTDKWVPNLEMSLGLYNLFNTRYSQPAGASNWQNTLQQDGRQIHLKAIYAF